MNVLRTNNLPRNPAVAYRGRGWAGWAKLLGTAGGGEIDQNNQRTVLLALLPVINGGRDLASEIAHTPANLSEMDDHQREMLVGMYTVLLDELPDDPKGTAWWERDLLLDAIQVLGEQYVGELNEVARGWYRSALAARAADDRAH